MAQIWRAKALAFKTGAAMAEYYPNINLSALIGLQSIQWSTFYNPASFTSSITPALNLPIFTAGAIGANIRANKAEFNSAIFAYNNLLLRSAQEVLDVLAFAKSITEREREQVSIVTSAKSRYDLTKLLQQKGLDSQFDEYFLKEEVIQRQLVEVGLMFNQYLASVKLVKALGGGYCQEKIPLVKLS
jgi:outer membrane protein TolC